jgi:acyl-CoA reductase-like NAD-dependent aldehyde dehydrogenase
VLLATEEKICDVTDCGRKEVDAAVNAATNAFYDGEYSTLSGYERGRLLYKLADLIEENEEVRLQHTVQQPCACLFSLFID